MYIFLLQNNPYKICTIEIKSLYFHRFFIRIIVTAFLQKAYQFNNSLNFYKLFIQYGRN